MEGTAGPGTPPPPPLRADPWLRAALLWGTLFLLIAADVAYGGLLTRLDDRIAAGVFAHIDGYGRTVIAGTWLSLPGDELWLFPVLAGASLALGQRTRARSGLLVFSSGVAGALLVKALKALFVRGRPYEAFGASAGTDPFYSVDRSASFPSGHAFDTVLLYALVFACVVALAPIARRAAARRVALRAWLVLVLGVGAARIASGVHWATDVLGSVALGMAWATATAVLVRRIDPDLWASVSAGPADAVQKAPHNP